MEQSKDTICALSTASGRAGVAVIRVSGDLVPTIVRDMTGVLPEPRQARFCSIKTPEEGLEIDRGIVLWFAGPSSFTGEDVAEFHVHGGRAVVASVLEALSALGCRLAEPGEFTRRAFENGKIDLTEAEGIADLIDAQTEAQRAQAVRQAGGGLATIYEDWRERLIGGMALVEAAIDFSDEADVALDAIAQARTVLKIVSQEIGEHLADGRRGEILRDGFHVVLAGAPNVGKSSLLNALARRDAAIVSDEPGTTRDVIDVRLDLGGLPVIVSDTAGLRQLDNDDGGSRIEQEGMRRTLSRAMEADLILWMEEADAHWQEVRVPDVLVESEVPLLIVLSKSDLHPKELSAGQGVNCEAVVVQQTGQDQALGSDRAISPCCISSLTGDGVSDLVARIAHVASERISPVDAPVITQARHRKALEACNEQLRAALAGSDDMPELVAEDIRLAANALGRITGRVDAEDVLDQVFGRFCIGK